ncbi:MAG TPA: sigma-70 family RNA polymerase sigma factor [Bacillota bacterium]|nr:sigma-70 family RNA polymerase sigma factor [Bacillota bacterium]
MPGEKNLSEENIVRMAQSGDEDAFAQLVHMYSADAFRTASVVLRNRSDAEDVVQEAFLTCYRKLHSFRMESSFKTWFYRVVVNLCYDRLRKINRENAAYGRISLSNRTGEWDMSEVEGRLDLKEMVASLSTEHRLVLTLYYGMDLGVQKISEILGIPAGTVKSRLNSARNLLKERLERGREYAL